MYSKEKPIMQFKYRKAVQALNFLARQEGGTINKMKALKLLWLADRLHLRKYGRTIINDHYKAMPNGPVASSARDILEHDIVNPEISEAIKYLKPAANRYFYQSVEAVNNKVFSQTDLECLQTVTDTFGNMDQFDLSQLSHSFPEWKRFEQALRSKEGRAFDITYDDFFDSGTNSLNKVFEQTSEHLQLSHEAFKGGLY